MHDVVWIKNPFSPPQEGVTVEEKTGRDSNIVVDEEMDFDRSSGEDKKAKAALRIPGLAGRSVHLSL